ncbi:MAG: hypothetical protein ACRD5R_04195 [Candidatus Acidiferrales bacterium]
MKENDCGKSYQSFPAARQMKMRCITHTYDHEICRLMRCRDNFSAIAYGMDGVC